MKFDPRNLIGRLLGFGNCLICGDYWNWKDPHMIQFSAFSSMFPYCQECNLNRPLEEKQTAASLLISRWMRDGSTDHNGMPWREVRRLASKYVTEDHA